MRIANTEPMHTTLRTENPMMNIMISNETVLIADVTENDSLG